MDTSPETIQAVTDGVIRVGKEFGIWVLVALALIMAPRIIRAWRAPRRPKPRPRPREDDTTWTG